MIAATAAASQAPSTLFPPDHFPDFVILDTDIGDDIDDAFALALALRSPELSLLGITTEYGDTELRAKLLDRFLWNVGQQGIPVIPGVPTPHNNVFTQAAYARSEDYFPQCGGAVSMLYTRGMEDDYARWAEERRRLRYFSEHFGYMPRTGRELLSEVVACQNGPDRLYPATVLAFGWQRQYGYRFNPRDIHLLSRLANDPARKESTRQKLTQSLLASVRGRRLVRPAGAAYATPGKVASLESQVDALSMSDLWTLYLSDRHYHQIVYRRQ